MTNISFDLCFDKFKSNREHIMFSSGINVIYGESGVGKSTFLLNLYNSNLNHNFNFNISNLKCVEKPYEIFQNPDHQLLGRTVLDELTFSGECHGFSIEDLEKIVESSIKKLPKTICPDINPGFLSGGEKEMLNIITSLQMNPSILLIDDGLSFLSKEKKIIVIKWLKEWSLKNDSTVIWVTSEKDDLILGDYSWKLMLDSFKKTSEYKNEFYVPLKIPDGQLNLNISELTYKYDLSSEIYSNISLVINKCRSLGIIGTNGSGKTTLAGICYKYLSPNNGSLRLSINETTNLKIGYIDQFPEHMIQLQTPAEFLKRLVDNKIIDRNMIDTFKNRLSKFGIYWDKIKDVRGVDLPWYVLRTLLIVCLTHGSYDILILDEPTSGLGWNQRVELRSYLKSCMVNLHFMIVSHDKDFINSLCDQIIDLDEFNTYQLSNVEYEKA